MDSESTVGFQRRGMKDLSLKSPETGKSKGLELVRKCRQQQELPLRLVSRITAETTGEVNCAKTGPFL
jgi:hypothetical protein